MRASAVLLRAAPLILLALVPARGSPQPVPVPPGQGVRHGELESIVVTARRRSEREQDVPITMAAFGAGELEARDIVSLDRLQRIEPSLHVFGFNARLTSISLRGLGGNAGLASDGLDGGVGVFVDDAYLGRPGAAMFNLADLERIEVLRGPQGTLFGRNTTAGAIRIVTRAPSLDAAEVALDGSVGSFGLRAAKGSVGGPLRSGGTMAGRLTFAVTHHDGYMYDVYRGEAQQNLDDALLRGQLLFAPSQELRVRVAADYGEQKQQCCSAAAVGVYTTLDDGSPLPNGYLDRVARLGFVPLPFDPFARDVATDARVQADMRQRGVSTQVDWALPRLDLTSITAYRDWDWNPRSDFDDTPHPAVTLSHTANRQQQSSQEVRIATRGRERLDYVAGFYHYAETVDGFGEFGYGPAAPIWFFVPAAGTEAVNDAALNGFVAHAASSVTTRSDALFGQFVAHLSPRVDLSLGARYTHERRHGGSEQRQVAGQSLATLAPSAAAAAQAIRDRFHAASTYSAAVEDDGRTGNLTLSFRMTPAVLGYVTAARGRKAGGINIGNFPSGFDPAVRPETVEHYEIGAKGTALSGDLIVNVALYRTRVSDYQTSLLQSNVAGARPLQHIFNIDEARSQGGEIDVTWAPSERLEISVGLAHTDAEYASFPNGVCPPEVSLTPLACDLSGQSIAGAPERAASVALRGSEPLARSRELHWQLEHDRQSAVHTAVSNSRYSLVEGYGLTNVHVGVRRSDRRWGVELWIRNLADEHYYRHLAGRSTGLIAGLTGEPRTAGLTYRGRF
jgi:iron complex outermembrane receptor protein